MACKRVTFFFFLSMKTLIQRQYSGSVWKYYLALALFKGTLPWRSLISRHLTSTGQNPLIRRPFWELMGQVWGMREKQDAASNSHHRCTGPDFSPALWLIMLLHLFFVYIWQSPTEEKIANVARGSKFGIAPQLEAND